MMVIYNLRKAKEEDKFLICYIFVHLFVCLLVCLLAFLLLSFFTCLLASVLFSFSSRGKLLEDWMVVLSEEEGRTLIKTDGFVCLIPGGKCVYTDYTLTMSSSSPHQQPRRDYSVHN